jgi:putative RNA 2'-phosphotransferase
MSHEEKALSKLLSLVLRHRPETIGVELDDAGWVAVDTLLARLHASTRSVSRELLDNTVHNNDKQRFAYNKERTHIRASQGHSLSVDLALAANTPPDQLFHGTATRFLASIQREGIKAGKRHHVHLSATLEVALTVGARHGKAVVLDVDARAMCRQGHVFFQSENGVWLTDHVPVQFFKARPE